MNALRLRRTCAVAAPIALILAVSGCATKKYVAKQVAPVNQRVDTLTAQTDQKFATTDQRIAAVSATEQKDVSQLSERITTTDTKVTQLAEATGETKAIASDAAKQAQANAA